MSALGSEQVGGQPRLVGFVLIVVLAALVAGLRVGGRTPKKSNGSPSPGLSSMWFADRLAGFAATSSGVFSTADGGYTWRRRLHGVAVDSLVFVDREHGWALAGPRLLRTVDGGESWQQVMLELSDPLSVVDFVTAQDGWAATSSGEVAVTDDGGEQWVRQRSLGRVESVCFVDRDHGWAAGAGAVQATVDGGRHWQLAYQLPSVVEPHQEATAHCKGNKAWVLFQGNGAASKQDYNLVAGELGTNQWTVLAHGFGFVLEHTLPGAPDVHDLGDYSGPFAVVDADTALLIGECHACAPSEVFLTVAHLNGPWAGHRIPALDGTAHNVSAAFFVDAAHGWVTGTRSEDDAAVIASTADGGIDWTTIPAPPR